MPKKRPEEGVKCPDMLIKILNKINQKSRQ